MSNQRIGVISDTHSLLRPEAVEALRGSHVIIHAGDIGREGILSALEEIAPVMAVRGNVDQGAWTGVLPWSRVVSVGEARLFVIHDIHTAPPHVLSGCEYSAIISGHTHRPSIDTSGCLLLNPGSAGPRRFHLPVTVAVIEVEPGGTLRPRIVPLDIAK